MASEQERPVEAAAETVMPAKEREREMETPTSDVAWKERPVEEATDTLRTKERELKTPTRELASKVAVPAETHEEKHYPAETVEKHAAAPAGTTTTTPHPEEHHKPSFMEQIKEKVVEVKDKLTGHDHHASPKSPHHQKEPAAETHETTTTTAGQSPKSSPKGESFLQKIKDKLPGGHSHEQKSPTTAAAAPAVPVSSTATKTVPVQSSTKTGTTAATTASETVPVQSSTKTSTTAAGEHPHHEGIGEKMSLLFKGHGSETSGEHKKEHHPAHKREGSGESHAVTERDALKE
ncbi:hypothetical protein R1flu_015169 [Riccia fluitans]|uniref:Allergen n=1 Tax=Riccia fluitans TaxID=41844 RepID=A0ABD1YI57_9MARC